MNNIKEYLNFGINFSKKYMSQYFRLLLQPILFGILAFLLLKITTQNPSLILLAFLSIPLVCYAFWKGYLITYTLNFAAITFEKKIDKSLEELLKITKQKEKELAKYLGFCAIISIVAYLPTFIYVIANISNFSSILSNPLIALNALAILILNSLFLLPFYNFFNQAFLFKKDNESFFDLVLNCYKKLDKIGIGLSFLFAFLGGIIGGFNPIIYVILALTLNLLTFSVNTIWYKNKIKR